MRFVTFTKYLGDDGGVIRINPASVTCLISGPDPECGSTIILSCGQNCVVKETAAVVEAMLAADSDPSHRYLTDGLGRIESGDELLVGETWLLIGPSATVEIPYDAQDPHSKPIAKVAEESLRALGCVRRRLVK